MLHLHKERRLRLETKSCDFFIDINKMFPYIYSSISSSSVNCCAIPIRVMGSRSRPHQSLGEEQEQTQTTPRANLASPLNIALMWETTVTGEKPHAHTEKHTRNFHADYCTIVVPVFTIHLQLTPMRIGRWD